MGHETSNPSGPFRDWDCDKRNAGARGRRRVFGAYFETWMAAVVWLPLLSFATAEIVCAPLATLLVFHR